MCDGTAWTCSKQGIKTLFRAEFVRLSDVTRLSELIKQSAVGFVCSLGEAAPRKQTRRGQVIFALSEGLLIEESIVVLLFSSVRNELQCRVWFLNVEEASNHEGVNKDAEVVLVWPLHEGTLRIPNHGWMKRVGLGLEKLPQCVPRPDAFFPKTK